jgi:outer membrane usher protein
VSGTATELAEPDREPIAFFTNRDGRFGVFGLAPGQWLLRTTGGTPLTYVLEVPDTRETLAAGELHAQPVPNSNGDADAR